MAPGSGPMVVYKFNFVHPRPATGTGFCPLHHCGREAKTRTNVRCQKNEGHGKNSRSKNPIFMTNHFNVLAGVGRILKMKSWLWAELIIGACLTAPLSSHGSLSFVGNAYVELNPNGGGNTYYWVNNSDGVNSQFSGTLLSIVQGQTLMLGGQAQTYQPQFGVTVTMHYAIDQNSTFSSFNLNYFQTANGNDWWDAAGVVNLDGSLGAGSHTLYVWYSATDGTSTVYDNAGGVNYSAQFTVTPVPEPITLALPVFGGLVLTTGLVRRFIARRVDRAV